MKKLSQALLTEKNMHPVKVIQFGEGNFMRAFIDWQIQQMNKQSLFNGKAAVIQPIRQGLGEMLKEQDCLYTVILEGLQNGEIVNTSEIIDVIDTVIDPYREWGNYLALAENPDIQLIVSNTTEAGIQYTAEDKLADAPPSSFPAKLTALLFKRYQLGLKGFTIIPCELIDRNGEKLKEIVMRYSADWALGQGFSQWLNDENTFCCSLVDRIVPGYPRETAGALNEKHGYIDSLMVKAEPFMLWVIEGTESVRELLPLEKAGLNVIVTSDMTPYRERKVHLLNGPHTAMVPLALLAGLSTVEDVMKDTDFRCFADNLFADELILMLSLPESELTVYAEQIKERFLNPFAHHQLTAIALNSVSKFKARLLPVLLKYQQETNSLPPYMTSALAALLLMYRGDKVAPRDSEDITAFFKDAWEDKQTVVQTVLSEQKLWGQDLTKIAGLAEKVSDCLQLMEDTGSRALLQQLNQKERR